MSLPRLYQDCTVTIYDRGEKQAGRYPLVSEVPLTVYLNDTELATLICSPGHYQELAAGFLISEGLVQDVAEIREISSHDEDGLVWVKTSGPVPQTENFLRRQIASCCGKGRALLYFVNDARQVQPVHSDTRFAVGHLLTLMDQLEERSRTFRQTGGVHCAALGDQENLLVMHEDIGRHNAVDKVFGDAFLNRTDFADKCLLLSGRISSEILIKAARRGIGVVVSRKAPTLLTVDLAAELDLTVVGFARGQRLCIYSHAERIFA